MARPGRVERVERVESVYDEQLCTVVEAVVGGPGRAVGEALLEDDRTDPHGRGGGAGGLRERRTPLSCQPY